MIGWPASPEAIADAARPRLQGLLAAAERTEFWRARLRAAGIAAGRQSPSSVLACLGALPPVTKRELRVAGLAAVRDGWVRPWWPSSRSSGSTGEPFRVWFDPHAWVLLKYAIKLRARSACGVGAADRIAVLDAFPPSEEGRFLPGPARRLRRISVLQPAEVIADKLARHRPAAVYGLPSALLETGRVLAASGRRIPVRAVFTGGELLQPGTRQAIAAAFGAPVRDVYGTSETKEIAWECPAGGRHVNADVLLVEVLGPTGEVLPPGDEGSLVVSVLPNRAMPLLRYRTGDRGWLSPEPCPCGCALPLLGVVTGREAEVLELEPGRRVSPYALTIALERVAGMLQYQVTQTAPSCLRVRAIPAVGADHDRLGEGIREELRRAAGGTLTVDVELIARLPRGARDKVRAVVPLEHHLLPERGES